MKPDLFEEKKLWRSGYRHVAGIDEVGRGAFAGPLVVGAVIFPTGFSGLDGVNDSKLLTYREREMLVQPIKKAAKAWAVAEIPVRIINHFGIGKASQIGFRKVIKLLHQRPDFVLVDAFYIKHFNRKSQKPIIKGDQKSISIAAASVIAKVYRDKLMEKLHFKYPRYGFGKHKGYGTKFHQSAIIKHGLNRTHRMAFTTTFLKNYGRG